MRPHQSQTLSTSQGYTEKLMKKRFKTILTCTCNSNPIRRHHHSKSIRIHDISESTGTDPTSLLLLPRKAITQKTTCVAAPGASEKVLSEGRLADVDHVVNIFCYFEIQCALARPSLRKVFWPPLPVCRYIQR